MSAGAKVTIAVVILFTVLLGVYYGFGGLARPDLADGSDPAESEPQREATAPPRSPPGSRTLQPPPSRTEPARGGVLSETVSRAVDERAVPAADARGSMGVLGHDRPSVPPREPQQTPAPSPGVQPLGFNEPRSTILAGGRPEPSRATTPPPPSPVPVPASPQPQAGTETYTVEEDDSMWTIADDWLGRGSRWPEIAQLNPQIDPHRLSVGQKIVVPARGRSSARPAAPASPPPQHGGGGGAGWVGEGLEYTVKSGDTLSTIAKAYFGEASKWQAVYDANRPVIGGDPGRLKIGMKLRIPGKA